MIWLTGCETGDSDVHGGICPPIAEYDRAVQLRAADEIAQLPQNTMISGWMVDYSVTRPNAQSYSAGVAP